MRGLRRSGTVVGGWSAAEDVGCIAQALRRSRAVMRSRRALAAIADRQLGAPGPVGLTPCSSGKCPRRELARRVSRWCLGANESCSQNDSSEWSARSNGETMAAVR